MPKSRNALRPVSSSFSLRSSTLLSRDLQSILSIALWMIWSSSSPSMSFPIIRSRFSSKSFKSFSILEICLKCFSSCTSYSCHLRWAKLDFRNLPKIIKAMGAAGPTQILLIALLLLFVAYLVWMFPWRVLATAILAMVCHFLGAPDALFPTSLKVWENISDTFFSLIIQLFLPSFILGKILSLFINSKEVQWYCFWIWFLVLTLWLVVPSLIFAWIRAGCWVIKLGLKKV